ncbi:MAG: DUF4367 domain-containing protein [Ruminococcaceae bacterium]|nr:DUF4367 domain-containing protein [Oscillospiraceae bacterium]
MDKTAKFDILEAMLYTAAPLAGQKELDEYKTAPAAEFSEKAQNKIYKKLCKEQKYYSKHENYSPVRESFKRAAIVILAVMSISFTCVLSIEAAREAIWNAIIEWSEQFFCFKYCDKTDTPDAIDETALPEPPTEILEFKEPVVDEKFERREMQKTLQSYGIEYGYSDKLVIYNQKLISDYDMLVSNLSTELTNIKVKNYMGIICEETIGTEKYYSILWKDESYAYIIIGNIEYSELMHIVESLY